MSPPFFYSKVVNVYSNKSSPTCLVNADIYEVNTAFTETDTYRAKDYLKLRGFYNRLIKLMDVIHYNSNVTKSVYREYMDISGADECVMPISHSDIGDHKKIRSYEHKLRITYLGAQSGAKGYFTLR